MSVSMASKIRLSLTVNHDTTGIKATNHKNVDSFLESIRRAKPSYIHNAITPGVFKGSRYAFYDSENQVVNQLFLDSPSVRFFQGPFVEQLETLVDDNNFRLVHGFVCLGSDGDVYHKFLPYDTQKASVNTTHANWLEQTTGIDADKVMYHPFANNVIVDVVSGVNHYVNNMYPEQFSNIKTASYKNVNHALSKSELAVWQDAIRRD